MKRKIIALTTCLCLIFAVPGAALADPAFGPGNTGGGEGNSGPQDSGAKCHPPGQTVDTPGCK